MYFWTGQKNLTFVVRETVASRHNERKFEAPLQPLNTTVLWCSRGLKGPLSPSIRYSAVMFEEFKVAQIKGPLKPLNTIVLWCSRDFHNSSPWCRETPVPRTADLGCISSACTLGVAGSNLRARQPPSPLGFRVQMRQ